MKSLKGLDLALSLVVLIKQVPDIQKVKFDVEKGRVDRSSAEAEINPFDLNALEAAVEIKEKLGGKVIAISMGPPQAEAALRDALSRGADEAILLEDSRFAGADTLATSFTLSYAVKKLGKFDIIFCGEKTVDGDTGQVGPEVSEHLNVPIIPYVSKILKISSEGITASSEMGDVSCTFEARFPVLLTVTKDLNRPRLPSLKDKLRAKKAEIKIWRADDLADVGDLSRVGYQGSPTSVYKVVVPPEKERKGEIYTHSERAIERLVDVLRERVAHIAGQR